jgi:hypothetical protein
VLFVNLGDQAECTITCSQPATSQPLWGPYSQLLHANGHIGLVTHTSQIRRPWRGAPSPPSVPLPGLFQRASSSSSREIKEGGGLAAAAVRSPLESPRVRRCRGLPLLQSSRSALCVVFSPYIYIKRHDRLSATII